MPLFVLPLPDFDWFWRIAIAAGLLLVYSLASLRSSRKARSRVAEGDAVLDIYPLLWVYSPEEAAALIKRQPGVRTLELDVARGTARVTIDPQATSIAELHAFVGECYRHCSAQRAPGHRCPTELNDH